MGGINQISTINGNSGISIKNDNYIPFYFPQVDYRDSYIERNESNLKVIFEASDGKYHNLSLTVNITKGKLEIDLLVDNCQDFGAGHVTNGSSGSFSYNFIAYKVELQSASESNQTIPNNYFGYTVEVNGSYLLVDHRATSKKYDPCANLFFDETFVLVVLLVPTTITVGLLALFIRKKVRKD